jgi:sphingolipid 4-desaturase/C4-monooxygenase
LLVLWFWGLWALGYLLFSLCMGLGIHPLGARWIQEHYTATSDQETFSYYGPLRFVQLNVGCHNEHHDFPGIPWNRLHLLRQIAPESYSNLRCHQSLSRLLFDFVWHGVPGIQDRIIRSAGKGATPPSGNAALELN